MNAQPAPHTREAERPRLVFFYDEQGGRSRRADGFLAQVLQSRGNPHDTFRVVRVSSREHPDLVERFRVADLPTILIVEQQRVARRIEGAKGPRKIHDALEHWLK